MHVRQVTLTDPQQIASLLAPLQSPAPSLVIVFAAPAWFASGKVATIRQSFPQSVVVGCSTAGEIAAREVLEEHCVITTLQFASTAVSVAATELAGLEDCVRAGERLARELQKDPKSPHLKAVLLFGPGLAVNGSALVQGLNEVLSEDVLISGGLAGDNGAFTQTWVLSPEGISSTQVVALGLAGEKLSVGHGAMGGWSAFGPTRKITACRGNVLLRLDSEPALDVYKRYLGEYAKGLPATGLLFPFEMLDQHRQGLGVIRTILGVDEAEGSLLLAGDIDPDGYLRLMQASTAALVEGAELAAGQASTVFAAEGDQLALLVSCVGRKLIMGDLVDDEVDAVAEVLSPHTTLAGFYS